MARRDVVGPGRDGEWGAWKADGRLLHWREQAGTPSPPQLALSAAMKGRKRSRWSPPSYRASGWRLEVAISTRPFCEESREERGRA